MNLSQLEKERGYIVGAAARIREKLGLPAVSEEDAIKNIEAQKIFETSNSGHFCDATAPFRPQLKEKDKKGAK